MPPRGHTMSDAQKAAIRDAHLRRGTPPTKRCPQCGETKDRAEFGVRTNGYSKSWCRPCEATAMRDRPPTDRDALRARNRRTGLLRSYGLTVEQYDAMAAAQGGLCAICGEREEGRNGFLYVDHCHATNWIRGLLCSRCNHGIGHMRDNATLLRAAAAYVDREMPEDALIATPDPRYSSLP